MSFDWRTEDEHGWDAPDLVSSSPNEQKPEGKRRWLRWLIPLGLLLVALMVVGWTINKRVRTATAQVELDVVASHALVEQAIARQDVDLFQSVLSGRDSEWTAGMMRLVAAGDLMERDGLGLIRLPVTEPITPTVEVSADLLEAEVMTVLPYAIEVGNGLTETVFLAQTAVYRRGTNRWLLASPDAAYWGDIGRIKSQYVTLSYPERDKEIALDLLLSLDAKIGQVCTQLPDIDCPDNYQVSVALSTDPDSFRQLSLHAAADNAQKRHLILPTPTLAGLPLDQAGKSALLRGYGQLATTAILTDLWGYDCCKDTSVLYFALLRDTLRQLGLMPWPGVVGDSVSPSQYDHLFKNGLPQLFSGASFWYQMEDGTLTMPDMRADMLTAFAREELGLTAPELVISLNMMRSSQSFGEWLQDAIFNRLSARELENAWLGFVYDHSSLAQQMPPVPLPDQDIQLLCHIGSEERMAFYRYQLTDDSTQLEQSLNREVNVMVALPNDDGLAVWEAGFNNDATSMFFWVDDKRIEISWDAGGDAPGSVPMKMDPSQSKLILAPAYEGQVKYGLLDVSG
ncbi:MAG: hypothetical protein IAF02_18985, partial [Anaerolineae bacterium]|nr:hypothetical protein [Anaerolineae bacterium]